MRKDRGIRLNWEADTKIPKEWKDIDSPKLDQWLKEKRYHYGAAFAVFRAVECLKRRLDSNNQIKEQKNG